MEDLKAKIKEYFNSNTCFITFALLWVLFSVILPIIIINNKYHLFVKNDDGYKFTGWALVCLLIIFIGVYALLSYIIHAYNGKYRTWVKIVKGFKNIILPLIVLYLACDIANKNVETIKNVLCYSTLCECVAVIINPFPKWVFERKVKDTKEIYGLNK